MAAVTSAGLLLYRRRGSSAEVFLVHPGGPYWAKQDDGAWSVPKGIVDPHEDEWAGARREFHEETGFDVDASADARDLGTFPQPSGKRLRIWAIEGDWFDRDLALRKIVKGQRPVIDKFYVDLKTMPARTGK
jgi:predicted NUDIX family NTP pyrophosphohydrolase